MTCQRSTLKKYAGRPGPPYPANDPGCRDQVMTGNDGLSYTSQPDKRGVYTWKPAAKTLNKSSKTYKIHDNGGTPYTIQDYPSKKELRVLPESGKPKTIKYVKLWLSSPASKKFGDWTAGNTVLIQTKSGYIHIGREIWNLKLPGDEVVEYMSPIGNNDVPYPYIIGTNNIYFMLDMVYLPKELLNLEEDVYSQYYENAKLKEKAKKMNAN